MSEGNMTDTDKIHDLEVRLKAQLLFNEKLRDRFRKLKEALLIVDKETLSAEASEPKKPVEPYEHPVDVIQC